MKIKACAIFTQKPFDWEKSKRPNTKYKQEDLKTFSQTTGMNFWFRKKKHAKIDGKGYLKLQ